MAVIVGTNNPETLDGTSGDDDINGKQGDDTLNGLDGNDLFRYDTHSRYQDSDGADVVNGGNGSDTFLLTGSQLFYTQDTSSDNAAVTPMHYSLTASGANALFTLIQDSYGDINNPNTKSTATRIVTLNSVETIQLDFTHDAPPPPQVFPNFTTGLSTDDSVVIGDLSGTALTNPIYFDGGNGNDTLSASAATNVIEAHGGDGNDSLSTGSANDSLYGEAGNDTLNGGGGNDQLYGGAGNNTLIGGAGSDSADYSGEPAGVTINLSTGTGTNGYGGAETLSGIDAVVGTSFNDMLVGSTASEYLIGGAGNDVLIGGSGAANALQGGAGNDIYAVEAVGDTLIEFAGEGTDQIQTNLSLLNMAANIEQMIYTGAGNFTGIGNSDDNLIVGGVGSDYLIGGAGNDVLIGHAGAANALQGGTGNDIYAVEAVGDTVTEFAGEGFDQVQTNLSSFTLPSNVEELIYTGPGNFTGVGNSGDNVIIGASHDDTLTGAGGADRFVFSAPSGHDTITDFTADNVSAGHDLIDLQGRGLTFADLTVVQNGSDTDITLHGADTIHLVGVSAAQVDAGDFLF